MFRLFNETIYLLVNFYGGILNRQSNVDGFRSQNAKTFFNINMLSAVLKRSVLKRRYIRGETGIDRQLTTVDKSRAETSDKKVTMEESRSNSQASGGIMASSASMISKCCVIIIYDALTNIQIDLHLGFCPSLKWFSLICVNREIL